MKADDIDVDIVHEYLNKMPEDVRQMFDFLMAANCNMNAINIIKRFIEDYEHDDPIDSLLSQIVGRFLVILPNEIHKDFMQFKEANPKGKYTGIHTATIAARILRSLADNIENMLTGSGFNLTPEDLN
jgi:hypothetical protein